MKVFGSNDAVSSQIGEIPQAIGGPQLPIDALSPSGAPVDSVNGQTGVVVLDADDIDDSATANKFVSAADLSAIQALGTMSTQDADSVNISGGAASGLTTLQVDDVLIDAAQISTVDALAPQALTIKSGDTQETGANVVGASLSIVAGGGYRNSGGATQGKGGDLLLMAGPQLSASGIGGNAELVGGFSTVGRLGGSAAVVGAPGAESSTTSLGGIGGSGQVRGGSGGANSGGAASGAGGNGGGAAVLAGDGGPTNNTGSDPAGAGGDVLITAGQGGAATAGTGNGGDGGDVLIIPGIGGSSVGGTSGPTGKIRLDGQVNLDSGTVPATATDPGEAGDIAWDSNFFYVCVATNTWVRAALSTW